MRAIALWVLLSLLSGCRATSHPASPSSLGRASPSSRMESLLAQPGPVELFQVVAADWESDLSGLLNLDHPAAEAAGKTNRREPIQIFFYAFRHPTRGTFLIDSGVERAIRAGEDDALSRGLIGRLAKASELRVKQDTAQFLSAQPAAPRGIFLTHLHFDHVLGLRDLPLDTRVYVGPGEVEHRHLRHLVTRGTIDRALEGFTVEALQFEPDPDGQLPGVLDLFGDGSVFALHVPGHTPGSLAFVIRRPEGPALVVGDASHTAWGWSNGVEPGKYSSDLAKSAASLQSLKALSARHPQMEVYLGHQSLTHADQPAAGGER
jgi:N-acyl homoserine lactone hydrolase